MSLLADENEWLIDFRRGDAAADEKLFSLLFRSLCFYAERLTGSRQEAEDIVVDSFLKCYRQRTLFGNLGDIRAFLYTIVKNAGLNYLAAEKRHGRSHKEWQRRLEAADEPLLVEDALIRTEVLEEIYNEVEGLPPRCKEVIWLTFKEGLSTDEVAARLGIDPQNVRSQKARGLQLLRSRLLIGGKLSALVLLLNIWKG